MNLYDEIILKSAEKNLNKTEIVFKDKKISYRTLKNKIDTLAENLYSQGIRKGDKVGIFLPNSPEYIYSLFAIVKLGAVAVPANPGYKEHEISHVLSNSQSKAVILSKRTFAEFSQINVKKDLPSLSAVIVEEVPEVPLKIKVLSLSKLLEKTEKKVNVTMDIEDNDVAVIIYTSGTTGLPKGAMLTHKNLCTNVRTLVKDLSYSSKDSSVAVLPLFHVFGLTICLLTSLSAGIKIVLLQRFIPQEVVDVIEKNGITILAGVPTMFAYIVNNPGGISKKSLKYLRFCFSGGAPLSVEILNHWESKFKVPIIEGYGLSETSPVISYNPLKGKRKIGSVGKVITNVQVKIVNDLGLEVPANTKGEIAVKGENIMLGYYNDEIATANAIKDGWFYTGDIGHLDEEGYLYISERKKDVVIVGGFNVYPREIEDELRKHSKVEDVAVFGVFDQFRGEAVKAVIIPKKDVSIGYEEIMDYCHKNLVDYKCPRYLEFSQSFPLTYTGKIKKEELKK